MLHSEHPFNPLPVNMLPRKPPRKAPTIPIRIVTTTPPGSGPGMSALAIAPAIKPSTIHATIPIVLPPQRGRTMSVAIATRVPQSFSGMHEDDVLGRAYDARLMRRPVMTQRVIDGALP